MKINKTHKGCIFLFVSTLLVILVKKHILKSARVKRNSRSLFRGEGIPRSVEEQQKEAIGILSAALRSSLKRLRRQLEVDRNCDWTSGRWVRDKNIVYGEGALAGYRHCLVDHRQNCKRNQVNVTHLGYRWVLNDENCEASRISFTRRRFLTLVQNKKIAFIGDSLTRNMFQSLACLLYVPFKKEMVEEHMYRYRYPEFNVIIEFIKSNYLVRQARQDCDSDTTVKLAKAPCLDIMTVDPTWATRASEFDILMFATGGWWEHDLQMRQASSGEDSTYTKSQYIFHTALNTVMNHLARAEFQGKQLFWRCSEVSHFFGGEWNTGGQCRRSTPSSHSLANAVSLFIEQAVIDCIADTSSNITLFDITEMSSYRQDAHPSSQTETAGSTDCKHWCLPGVPDHWNEIWLNILKVKSMST
ncbi:protein trichome birefringence-like 6 isoform X2 [Dendronephthya gigantea]|uniref:protein trichome birefringence-like 6 isoform X2 n=1 Tax=Dendronephthya gigantea TaxID=151771 RepID=UPI00106A552B|nr:protein trichome birefringence-like 6 isoform X2 [Dendronephthya gigantea]